jgi:hypothetical protein
MKRAPRISEHKPFPLGEELPEHYLTAATLEEYHELGGAFMAAARRTNPEAARQLETRIRHEEEHVHAINKLGGEAVRTLVVYKPEWGLDGRHYPFHLKTTTGGLEPGSPEDIVSTTYPEVLSASDRAYLDRRGLTVADVDKMAVEHGWYDLRPSSLHQGQHHYDKTDP